MIVIFRGVSGSWKSTMAKILEGKSDPCWDTGENIQKDCEWAQYMLKLRQETKDFAPQSFSADHFFTDPEGNYNFNPKYLSEAHNQCLRRFVEAAKGLVVPDAKPALLIVDNTSCSIAEVAAYASIGSAYGHRVQVITLIHDLEDCAKKNVHKVPTKSILHQRMALDESIKNWPHWWPQEIFFT